MIMKTSKSSKQRREESRQYASGLLAAVYFPVTHQFSLFTEVEMRLKTRVPMSSSSVRAVKNLLSSKDYKGAAEQLRDIRERLEEYEERITNRKK